MAAKHDTIKQDLIKKLVEREFKGSLPPMGELADAYGVNIKTVRKALDSLKKDGIVESIPGAGSFIRNPDAFYGLKPFKIGLISICRERETPYYGEVSEMISQNSPEYNSLVSCVTISKSGMELDKAVDHLTTMDLDGYIIGPGDMGRSDRELRGLFRDKPFVVFHGMENADYDRVCHDPYDSFLQMSHYLLDQGHKRIVLLKSKHASDRYKVFSKVLERRGIAWDPELLVLCEGDQFSAYQSFREFLKKKVDFSAVFAHNDPCAIGAYYALFEAGLRIPEDISVVGVDNIPDSLSSTPPLTTISHEPNKMARACLDILTKRLKGELIGVPSRREVVKSRIIPRQSVAHPLRVQE